MDADHLEGVTWTEDGVLSTRPQWSGASASPSASASREAVLSIPPLPPRRDAALRDAVDDFDHVGRVVPVWFPRVAAFLVLPIFLVIAVLLLLLR